MTHLIVWIIVSGIAGFVASKIFNKSGSGLLTDMALGFIGGCAGGFFVYHVPFLEGLGGHAGFTGAAMEVVVAILGAMLVIWLYERAVALEGGALEANARIGSNPDAGMTPRNGSSDGPSRVGRLHAPPSPLSGAGAGDSQSAHVEKRGKHLIRDLPGPAHWPARSPSTSGLADRERTRHGPH